MRASLGLPAAVAVLFTTSISNGQSPPELNITSTPPVAVIQHDQLVYQIVAEPPSEASSATYALIEGPSGAAVSSSGEVTWPSGAASPEPVSFIIELTGASAQTTREDFVVLVFETLPELTARVVAAAGVDEAPDIIGSGGIVQTSEEAETGDFPCPPGTMSSTASGDACSDDGGGFSFREWILIDRNCEHAGCLSDTRYLQLELNNRLLDDASDNDPRTIVYMSRNWNRGRPHWEPMGALSASTESSRGLARGINEGGVASLVIAREYAPGARLEWSSLDVIEADDVRINLLPRQGVSELAWFQGGRGFGPPATDHELAKGAQMTAIESLRDLGLKSLLTSLPRASPSISMVGRADEITDLAALDGVESIEIDRRPLPRPQMADVLVQTKADLATSIYGATGSGQVVAVLDTGVMQNHEFLPNRVTRVCANPSTCDLGLRLRAPG